MSDDIYKGEESLDAETQEVLNELKAEGHELAGDKAVEQKPEPEQPKTEPVKVEEPAKTQDEKPEEPKEETPEEPEDKPKREPRFVKSVPVGKFNEVRKEAQAAKAAQAELEKQIAELKSKPATQEFSDNIDEAVKKVAEKHGLDPTVLLDLAKVIKPNTDLPPDVKAKLAEIDQFKATAQAQAESAAFETDFDNVASELPEIKSHKDKIKQLAYTEGYTNVPLRTLAIEFAHDNGLFEKGRKTAEPSSKASASQGAEVVDFDNVTEEQFINFTPEQQDKYLSFKEQQEAKQRGAI